MREFYETSYTNVHRGVYLLAERATEALRGRAREGAGLHQRGLHARGRLHAQRDRGAEPRRLRLGPRQPRPRRRRRRRPSSSTTRTSCPGSRSRSAPARAFRPIPIDGTWRAAARRARRDREAGPRQGRRHQPRLERARDDQPGRDSSPPGRTSRARSWSSTRRRRAPHRRDRRPGARLRLPRLLLAQALRPDGRRRALGPRRAARADVALQLRRRDDPQGHGRGDELERASVQVRGRHAADRRGGRRWAPRSTT